MPYFPNFPTVNYKFGNETYDVLFPNLAAYSNILDEVKKSNVFYSKYYIKEGMRPDHVSYELYGTPDYHWTFYLLNDHIREQGWPLDHSNLEKKINENFPNTVLVTRDAIHNKFKVGQTITGLSSETTGTVIKRNLDLGQIWISGTKTFTAGELLEDANGEFITLHSYSSEREAAIYYVDADEVQTDIDPFTGPGELLTKVSYANYMENNNEDHRNMIILKPSNISQLVAQFKKIMRE